VTFFRNLVAVLGLAFMALPGACASPTVAQTPAPQTAAGERPVYRLGAGDKVRVTVFGEQSLNGEYPVGPDGTVALPLIGNMPARGLSASELQASIAKKLSPAYILDPRVSVDVSNFRPFYILGEVGRPGSYPYVDALSVSQAVAIAGGYSYRANTKQVLIRRADQATEQTYSLRDGGQVWVMPGDTVRVKQRFF